LRLELEHQHTLVMGVHFGYTDTDTDMAAGIDAPKNDPRQVARDIIDGIECGDTEVLADNVARQADSIGGRNTGLVKRV
jgi:hypothetical protein